MAGFPLILCKGSQPPDSIVNKPGMRRQLSSDEGVCLAACGSISFWELGEFGAISSRSTAWRAGSKLLNLLLLGVGEDVDGMSSSSGRQARSVAACGWSIGILWLVSSYLHLRPLHRASSAGWRIRTGPRGVSCTATLQREKKEGKVSNFC